MSSARGHSVALVVAGLLIGCAESASETVSTAAQDSTQKQQTADSTNVPIALLPDGPTQAEYPHLHNLLQITDEIYSGGEPEDDEAFASLAQLGVRTIVSVDGARPNVAAAQEQGLRYVHIPIGYNGVSDEAGRSLARLVREADGPFYVHCHHGKHRGPAAAAVACVAAGAADGQEALAILKEAGTSKDYSGLWRDVAAYQSPPADAKLPELVEIAEINSLAAAMAQIDRASDNLKLCLAVDWQAPPDHPDLVPQQEALMLREAFHETVRQLTDANPYDEQFLTLMQEAEAAAKALEDSLVARQTDLATERTQVVQESCTRCHKAYRN